jgi:hypothetical protein
VCVSFDYTISSGKLGSNTTVLSVDGGIDTTLSNKKRVFGIGICG